MEKIKVGILTNTHGLRGEVKVKITSDFWEERFAKNAVLYINVDGRTKELCVVNARLHKGMLIVKFKDYDDINQVEHWKGNALYIFKEQLHELNEDEAYYHEMMNARVQDIDGNEIGTVVELIETGANLVLRVRGEKREFLIPFVKAFVTMFDKEKKIMQVTMMEGL